MTYGQGTGRPGVEPVRPTQRWTPPQILTVVVGAVYTVLGLVGFLLTGFTNFAGHQGESLLGFHVNPLHNIVHLVTGVAGLALATSLARARIYGWALAIAYGVVFLYGLFAVSRPEINFLAINGADNVLHLVTALVGLTIALWRRAPVPEVTGRP